MAPAAARSWWSRSSGAASRGTASVGCEGRVPDRELFPAKAACLRRGTMPPSQQRNRSLLLAWVGFFGRATNMHVDLQRRAFRHRPSQATPVVRGFWWAFRGVGGCNAANGWCETKPHAARRHGHAARRHGHAARRRLQLPAVVRKKLKTPGADLAPADSPRLPESWHPHGVVAINAKDKRDQVVLGNTGLENGACQPAARCVRLRGRRQMVVRHDLPVAELMRIGTATRAKLVRRWRMPQAASVCGLRVCRLPRISRQ